MLRAMIEVQVSPRPLEDFAAVLDEQEMQELWTLAARGGELLTGRTVWCLNSTARGGGVAEMLRPLLGWTQGAGIDARWLVIDGDAPFFELTKRIHHRLHGSDGDGGPLGDAEQAVYGAVMKRNAEALRDTIRPGDVVLLHDPQTAGLAAPLRDLGALVAWRCHVGADEPNGRVHEAWDFLRPHVEAAAAYVFSRAAFVWDRLDSSRVHLIAPSIDALAPKNQPLSDDEVAALVRSVHDRAEIVGGPIPDDGRLVMQVSRWDPLKDPLGVLEGFTRHVPAEDAHLVLVGPSVAGVADDPEGADVLAEVTAAWEALPAAARERAHLVSLPMDDVDENAAMVNALQRRAEILVQKSLAEGFGLTVTEAMWKGRAIVATRVGGIRDQIEDGTHGLLLDDPRDLETFGSQLRRLLDDRSLAGELGAAAHERARAQYLENRHLADWVRVIATLHGSV
jgi:trehalose synthase